MMPAGEAGALLQAFAARRSQRADALPRRDDALALQRQRHPPRRLLAWGANSTARRPPAGP